MQLLGTEMRDGGAGKREEGEGMDGRREWEDRAFLRVCTLNFLSLNHLPLPPSPCPLTKETQLYPIIKIFIVFTLLVSVPFFTLAALK